MFTGIIETVQSVRSLDCSGESARLAVPLGPLREGLKLGDSVAVNGACLTVSSFRENDIAVFDLMFETLRCTNLGQLRASSPVNLERALSLGDRLGGHLVQGHIDGQVEVSQVEKSSENHVVWLRAKSGLLRWVMPKGSVTLDGVSLTAVDVQDGQFSVSLIPTTLEHTNLGMRGVGDRLNFEGDLIGKWVLQHLRGGDGSTGGQGLTLEKLRNQGFI